MKCPPSTRRPVVVLLVIIALLNFINVAVVQAEYEDDHDDDHHLSNAIDEHNVEVTENRLAAQLFALLEHYKQDDPVGLPGSPIPDPLDVPDIRKNLGMASLHMTQVKAHGISKFRIQRFNVDLKAMKVESGIQLDEMVVKGQYTLSSFFSKANGPFTVLLKKVYVNGRATLVVDRDGHLTTERVKTDITFAAMSMDFQNLGFLGSLFQSIVNSAPNLVFDTMKPFMMQEAEKKTRDEINVNIEKLMGERRLPNSISPLDMAIAEARKKVRQMGYDPYHLPDYNRTDGVLNIQLANIWLVGVSGFYRVGDMIVGMDNNTMRLTFQVGTQQISGSGQWEVGLGLISRIGHIHFTLQHIRVTIAVSQPLDTRQRPQVNDLQIDLGNIQVRGDGAGTLNYIMEFVVNVVPNLLRYQIMDALESPIKMRIQEKFNAVDVEKAIKENFHKFQSMGKDFSFDFKF